MPKVCQFKIDVNLEINNILYSTTVKKCFPVFLDNFKDTIKHH